MLMLTPFDRSSFAYPTLADPNVEFRSLRDFSRRVVGLAAAE
jgi:hypothetical protein